MQRSATITATGALSAALLLGLTACNPGFNGDDGVNGGGTPATSPVSQPGRYSSLPDPCRAPAEDRLSDLLPGADPESLPGVSRATYDPGRRAACDWASEYDHISYRLTVDFLRVISYDPEISDNDRAALDFAERAAEAAIPGADADDDSDADDASGGSGENEADEDRDPGEDGAGDGDEGDGGERPADPDPDNADADADATDSPADPADEDEDDDREAADEPDASGDPHSAGGGAGETADLDGVTRPEGELAPRRLDGIGTAAYIDDRLSADGTRHDITLVFHTDNVIVVIDYRVSVDDPGRDPGSATLQELVRSLARDVAGRFAG